MSKITMTWICSGQNKYLRLYTFEGDTATIDPNKKLNQDEIVGANKYEFLRESSENYEAELIVGGIKSQNVSEYLTDRYGMTKIEINRMIESTLGALSTREPESIFKELAFKKGMSFAEQTRLIDMLQGEFNVKVGRAIAGLDTAPPGDVKKLSDAFKVWASSEEKSCQKPASKSTKKSSSTSS